MPEVTKITVTFDDGTEHVVFQVAKVIEEPTPPCTIGDEPGLRNRSRLATPLSPAGERGRG